MSETDTRTDRDASDWLGRSRSLDSSFCAECLLAFNYLMRHIMSIICDVWSAKHPAPIRTRPSACGWPLEYPESVWSFESVLRTAEAESEAAAGAEAEAEAVANPDEPKRVVSSL